MIFPWRSLLDLGYIAIALWMQWKLAAWLLELLPSVEYPVWRRRLRAGWTLSAAWLLASFVYGVLLPQPWFPMIDWMYWTIRGFAFIWILVTGGMFVVVWLLRRAPTFDPARRRLLFLVRSALLATPVVVTGAGVLVERGRFQVVEQNIVIEGLPKDLDGLRIAHLSDIHLGPYLEDGELRRVVKMTNEMRPHLAMLTGDLITSRPDRLTDCLHILKDLKTEAGVFGCMGNHEQRARCQARAKREGARMGLDFLRGERRSLRFGDARLNLAGVDYQSKLRPYLVGAERLAEPGSLNVLLSHNPDVFPVAASRGFDLTLAGHTHGGQVTAGFLQQYLNLARFFTPYIYGAYREGGASIYVTRGIGTVGVPARIGAPPEIAIIRLCAI